MKCPRCAINIQEDEVMCHHCGNHITPVKHIEQIAETEKHGDKERKFIGDIDSWGGGDVEVNVKFYDLDKIYYPGDVVRLTIEINSEKQTKMGKISANLAIRQPVGRTLGASILNNIFSNTIGLSKEAMVGLSRMEIEREFTPIVTKVVKGKGNIPDGLCQSYRIDLKIPEKVEPTYNGGDSINISWFVRVMDDTSDELGLWMMEEINIAISPPDQPFKPLDQLIKGKNVEMHLKLPKLHWVEGEKIQGQLLVRPLIPDLGPVKVELVLREGTTFPLGGSSIIASDLLTEKVIVSLGEIAEYGFELAIPTQNRPSLKMENFYAMWYVVATAGKGLVPTSGNGQIYVYSAPARSKPISQIGLDVSSKPNAKSLESATIPVQKTSQPDENFAADAIVREQQKRIALQRLRGLHNDVARAKGKANDWRRPLLFGVGFGIMACLIASYPLVLLVEALSGSSEPSPVPGGVGLVILVIVWILTTSLFRRKTKQQSAILVSKGEAALKIAADEIAKQYPNWINEIGGTASLLDLRIVETLLMNIGVKQL